MNRLIVLPVLLATLAGTIPCQQVGDPNRDYTVNFNGSFQPSYPTTNICVPAEQMYNNYSTQDNVAPVIWAVATSGTIGWITTATNSVDVGPGGLTILLDGTFTFNANFINFFAHTDPFGGFNLSLPTSPGLGNQTLYFAMAHVAPTSPDNIWVSQTHRVNFNAPGGPGTVNLPVSTGTSCNASAVVLTLSDDSFAARTLNGSGFPYYGTSYNTCYVGSNGYVTFVSGDTTYVEDPSLLSTGAPRICTVWDDLNPGVGGTVRFYADPTGGFEVCFSGVPEFGSGGSNTFRLIAIAGSHLQMDYDANMSLTDGLVGVSPGGGGNVIPTDLSAPAAGGTPIPAGSGLYELFGGNCGPPFDLYGYQVTFFMNSSGTPVSQN